jgi:hypothetical protein
VAQARRLYEQRAAYRARLRSSGQQIEHMQASQAAVQWRFAAAQPRSKAPAVQADVEMLRRAVDLRVLHPGRPQAVLDNVEADFSLVNQMIDQMLSEAARLSGELGLERPLLPSDSPLPDASSRLSERMAVSRGPPPQQGQPRGPPPQQGQPRGPPPQQGQPRGPPPQQGQPRALVCTAGLDRQFAARHSGVGPPRAPQPSRFGGLRLSVSR